MRVGREKERERDGWLVERICKCIYVIYTRKKNNGSYEGDWMSGGYLIG